MYEEEDSSIFASLIYSRNCHRKKLKTLSKLRAFLQSARWYYSFTYRLLNDSLNISVYTALNCGNINKKLTEKCGTRKMDMF